MATDVVCPDCGGLVGAEAGDLRRKCTCNLSDTDHVGEPMGLTQQPVARKICCVCGKDVTGQKRAKDSRGYWCYDCHRAERAREKQIEASKVPCHDCGRLVLPAGLTSYEGDMICAPCRQERIDKTKFRPSVTSKYHAAHERRQLLLIVLFAALLIAVILLHHFHLV